MESINLFFLTTEALETLPSLDVPEGAGAVISFLGRVRNHNEGRRVLSLEYAAYQELAVKEGRRILEEASQRFPLQALRAVHRTGHLKIGDGAVVVEVASSHRGEAFDACRWIIDEIKERVPVWKKEYYEEGEPQWVICSHRHDHSPDR